MMPLTVYQTITIGQLRVDAVTNSSVLQIGSAGNIRSLSQLYNTGGFIGPAPEITQAAEALKSLSLVRLPDPA